MVDKMFRISIEEAEGLIYGIILDGESKDNYITKFQEDVIDVIKRIREAI